MTGNIRGQGNPWVAVRPGEDLDVLARRMTTAHRSFVEDRSPSDSVRSVVLDSWLRSRTQGVDPDGRDDSVVLSGAELDRYRDGHPMSIIRPVIRKLLVEDAADTGLLVAISDAEGRLLWVEGDSAAKDRASSMSFAEGVDWSEESKGTNAPGTALAVDHCVQIFAAEHFSRSVHEWSCSAAPVHHPTSGRILGAIDITGGPRVAVPEVLSLIRATVAAAESELRVHLMNSPKSLGDTAPRLEVLGSGKPGVVRSSGRVSLSQRHAEILLLLADHPEGLSSDHLAVLLDEHELDSVTIRAEMSRLRKAFGSAGLASRPYRLVGELNSDVGDIRRALDRGDVEAALRIYTGPVLPGSSAPGIEEIREELRSRVQAALLRVGDPVLLAQWTSSIHGRTDVIAWEAYRATLSSDSALYDQVSARLNHLDRQLGV
ncbi:MAG: transcriptional regulator [Rhodococcus sp. (in: high G+C Gram-positive bacteria)]|uniref:helix-turn-helix domain-containing protein n=1 Tax=Rhodococcus sp. EPR-157 TaxID=1813677 RepID=UPI0007BBCE85|nr:helix-turn-helix domain-containing protein [Rhodococcus sp. EPR-157]KZF08226.1 transcriptional regulator [Rhodococcus sp. EPR-157]